MKLLGLEITGSDLLNEGAITWMAVRGPFLVVVKLFQGHFFAEVTVDGTVVGELEHDGTEAETLDWVKSRISSKVDELRNDLTAIEIWARYEI